MQLIRKSETTSTTSNNPDIDVIERVGKVLVDILSAGNFREQTSAHSAAVNVIGALITHNRAVEECVASDEETIEDMPQTPATP